jgi:hypothetical protein
MATQPPYRPEVPQQPQAPALGGYATPGLRPGSGPPSPPGYPVQLEFDRQDRYSRLLIFVKWILAVPHYIVLAFVWFATLFAIFASWFIVLFTGRYPPGLHGFVVGSFRWTQRVTAYALLMTDKYPPFSLGEDPSYPVRMEVERPEQMARWRPLVHWILVIPYYIVAQILGSIWIYLIVPISWFAILFTGRYPDGLFDISVVAQRWNLRSGTYFFFLTDRYPPWAWG